MFNKIKQKFINVLNYLITRFMEDGFYLLFTTMGGMLITQQIIGWVLIFIGCFLGIIKIKKSYKKLEEIIFDTAKNISNLTETNNKLLLFDTKIQITENQYLDFALCVDNLTNQVIECIVDLNKSSFSVDGLTLAKEKMISYKNTLYPFAIHQIWTQIMNVEKLPINNEFEISLNIYLKYGAFLQPLKYTINCQFKGIFIIKIDDESNKYLELIKIIQPAS
jgi:hypothetical protein